MGKLFSKNNDNFLNNENTKIIKSGYFSTINQILRYNYDQGFNENRIENNMRICLEKKCFDELYDSEEIISPNYIYWLDYLYNYLSIEQNDKEWASEMLTKLDEEPFLTENKYLSHFFFKEFFLNTEPKCISQSKEEEELDDNNNDEFGNSNDMDLKISMNNSNMMRNLGGTFLANGNVEIDTNSSNQEKENETELKYKSFRNKVKKYIYIFRQHIIYKDHPINKVIQIFEEAWVKYVEKQIDFINNFDDKENDNYNINLLIDRITYQLQNFVIKMQICLKLFYCRAIDYSCFNNEKDELINLLTTLIFRTGKIYETVFKIQKIKLETIVEDMKNKYNQLKGITPQQLGIERQFCLNEETFIMQEEILEKEEKDFKDNDNVEEQKENSLNIQNKGVAQFYLTDEIMDKRKVQSLLADIKNKKKKIKKYKLEDMDNMKVDIDFGDENNNLLLTQSYYNRTGSIFNENNISSILPTSVRSTNSIMEKDNHIVNKNNIRTIDEYNMNNPEILTNNILFNNEKINDDNDNDNENDNNLIIRDHNEGRKTLTPFNYIKIFNRVSFWKDPDKSGEFISFPYETAIQLLKQIQKYKSPFEKMLIFASLGNEIKNCIDDFWKDMEDYIKNDLLGIEAEQLMTIFIYIIIKAQINDILVHCKLIQLFTTSMTKSSMIGYYYSNAEASVTFIQTLKDVKELYKGKNRIFENNSLDINDND